MDSLICSTCLFKSPNAEDYVSFHKKVKIKGHEELELNKMLYECANVDCQGMAHHQICKPCMKMICCLYDFRQTCLESQKFLNYKIENDEEEIDIVSHLKVECEMFKEEAAMPLEVNLKQEDIAEVINSNFDNCFNQDDDCLANYDVQYNKTNEDSDSEVDAIEQIKNSEFMNALIESSDESEIVRDVTDKSDSGSESNFNCNLCGKSFMKKSYLNKHLKRHKYNKNLGLNVVKDNVYACSICGKFFMKRYLFRRHEKRHLNNSNRGVNAKLKMSENKKSDVQNDNSDSSHQNDSITTTDENISSDANEINEKTIAIKLNVPKESSNEKFECDMCGKVFIQKHLIKRHLKRHLSNGSLGKATNEIDNFAPLTIPNNNESTGDSTVYPCRLCGNSFMKKEHLRKHHARHVKSSKLGIPMRVYKRKNDLINSETIVKIDESTPSGSKCEENETFNADVMCDKCGKSFSNIESFRKHRRRHLENENFGMGHSRRVGKPKSYLCDICGQYFVTEAGLEIHKTKHTNDKPFKCETCGKMFACKQYLRDHTKRHTEEIKFFCDICSKGFTRKKNLQWHIKIHTDERPHQCTLCDRRFLSKERCNLHIRTHSGEKPYSEIEKRRGKRIRRKKPKLTPQPDAPEILFQTHRSLPESLPQYNVGKQSINH